MRNSLLTIVLIACTFFIPTEAAGFREAGYGSTVERFIRVELYFGFDRKEQTQVSEDEWEKFLAEEVTPRFPDGFTVISAIGQYRGADGTDRAGTVTGGRFPVAENRKTEKRRVDR
ncbi:MAG: DUF3574 domain-containing protein [Acidobacteria bacterium]|nr:DUF3574 domain-containing protein [Acidobacteriota bacterium]